DWFVGEKVVLVGANRPHVLDAPPDNPVPLWVPALGAPLKPKRLAQPAALLPGRRQRLYWKRKRTSDLHDGGKFLQPDDVRQDGGSCRLGQKAADRAHGRSIRRR